MKLTELKPAWWPASAQAMPEATAVEFDCPGCQGTERAHRLHMPFASKNAHGTAWTEQGTGFEDLTFVDAPRGTRSLRVLGHPCHSHFNVTGGTIEFYSDSHSP